MVNGDAFCKRVGNIKNKALSLHCAIAHGIVMNFRNLQVSHTESSCCEFGSCCRFWSLSGGWMPAGSGSKPWSKETPTVLICPNHDRRSQCLRTTPGVHLAPQDGSSLWVTGTSQVWTRPCGIHGCRSLQEPQPKALRSSLLNARIWLLFKVS